MGEGEREQLGATLGKGYISDGISLPPPSGVPGPMQGNHGCARPGLQAEWSHLLLGAHCTWII